MYTHEIFEQVQLIAIAGHPEHTERIKKLTMDTPLGGDGIGLDSLDMVELTLKIEDHFSIEFDQEEADKLEESGDMAGYVALIEKHLEK